MRAALVFMAGHCSAAAESRPAEPRRARDDAGVRATRFVLGALAGLVIGACGARSSLPIPREDAGTIEPKDAGHDAIPDAPPDAPPDVIIPNDCVDAGITYI